MIKNYGPVSLLPVCDKIIFLRTRVLSIIHEIYKVLDANPSLEVRGVFLDLLKAFGKVWHDGLIYKLKRLGICGKYYWLIHSFLSHRHQ